MADAKRRRYDLEGAIKAGLTPATIAEQLAPFHKYDLAAARKAGIPDMESAQALADRLQPTKDEREADYFERFKYNYQASTSMTERAGVWLQSHFPIPEIKVGQDGKLLQFGHPSYSDDPATMQAFDAMTPDERIKYFADMNMQAARDANPDVAAAMDRGEDVGAFGAEFTKELLDPASLIAPAGVTVRGMAATSALWGGAYELLNQEYNNQERDFGKIGTAGAFGALGGAVMGKIAKEAPELLRKARQRPGGQRHLDALSARQGALEDEYIGIMASRSNDPQLTPKAVLDEAMDNLGLSKDDMAEMTLWLDTKMQLPLNPQQAVQAQAAHAQARASLPGTRTNNKWLDGAADYVTLMSDKMKEISPQTYGRMQGYIFNSQRRVKTAIDEVQPFLNDLNKMDASRRRSVELALFNGDFDDAAEMMLPSMRNNFDEVRNTLKYQLDEMRAAGLEVAEIEKYYPRMVKDHGEFNRAIGKEASDEFLNAKNDYLAKINSKRETPVSNFESLTEIQKTDFMNLWLRGYKKDPTTGKIRAQRSREVVRIQEELQDQYLGANDSLVMYLVNTSKAIERAKLFKRAAGDLPENIGLEESIGRIALNEGLDGAGAADMRRMLGALFGPGEQSPRQTVQFLRNMGYLTTLANPYSAAIQMADVGIAKYLGGTDVIPAAMASLAGRSKVTIEDLGMGDYITEQLSDLAFDQSRLAKFLGKSLKATGFQKMDKMGKESIMNSMLKSHQAAFRKGSGKQYDDMVKKFKDMYGEEDWQILQSEMKRGDVGDMTLFHLYNVVSEVQPTNVLQQPYAYANNPDTRLIYALKSFGLRQLNRIYRDSVDEYKKGNKKAAAQNLARFAFFVASGGASVDMMRDAMVGKELSMNDVPEYFAESVLRQMFLSRYALDNVGKGNLSDTIINTIAPPMQWMDDISKDMFNFAAPGQQTQYGVPVSGKLVPGIGKFYDLFVNGGLARANEKLTANDPRSTYTMTDLLSAPPPAAPGLLGLPPAQPGTIPPR